jgi:hypothetical protein
MEGKALAFKAHEPSARHPRAANLQTGEGSQGGWQFVAPCRPKPSRTELRGRFEMTYFTPPSDCLPKNWARLNAKLSPMYDKSLQWPAVRSAVRQDPATRPADP